MEKALKSRYHDAMAKLQGGKELDLLIVILPDNNGSLYGMLASYNYEGGAVTFLELAYLCTITIFCFYLSVAFNFTSNFCRRSKKDL